MVLPGHEYAPSIALHERGGWRCNGTCGVGQGSYKKSMTTSSAMSNNVSSMSSDPEEESDDDDDVMMMTMTRMS